MNGWPKLIVGQNEELAKMNVWPKLITFFFLLVLSFFDFFLRGPKRVLGWFCFGCWVELRVFESFVWFLVSVVLFLGGASGF